MNQAQRDAVQSEISYLEDNLYRYQIAQRAGNSDPTIARIIENHHKQIAELKQGL